MEWVRCGAHEGARDGRGEPLFVDWSSPELLRADERANNSAGVEYGGPISKQRNKHLQTVLVEAAKLAPRWNSELAALHARELAQGNRNRATLAVARKMWRT